MDTKWGGRSDKESVAIAGGVDFDVLEGVNQGFFERGEEEVFAFFEGAEGVDDKCAMGSERLLDGLKSFGCQKVRGRGVSEECVENDGVIGTGIGLEELASVSDGKTDLRRVEIKKLRSDRNYIGIDFDHIDFDSLGGEFHGNNPNSHADAEGVGDVRGVGMAEMFEHVSEEGSAFLKRGMVTILS